MKKLLMLILSLSMATVAFTSCGLFEQASETSSPATSVPTESVAPEKNEYTVTFQQAGETDKTVTVKEGEAVAEADIPAPAQKDGYTTVWKAEDLAKLTNVTGNVTVTAVATANSYTITFNAGEGVDFPATQKVTYDAEVTLSTPERAGYTFDGWYNGTTLVTSGAWKIASDVTLTAKWTEVAAETVTVTFNMNGTTVVKTVEKGATLTDIPAFPTDAGYEYSWSVTDFTNITENMTVNLVSTAKTFTITYDANGGTVVSGGTTFTVTYGQAYSVTAPTVEKAGFVFAGWEGDLPVGTWTVANNVTLTAQWTEAAPEMVTVTFNMNGTSVVKTVEKGATLTDIPAFPSDAGYEYSWSVTDFTNITENMTVTLNATPKTFKITYDVNGGTVVSGNTAQTVTYAAAYEMAAPTVTKEGYTFNGWAGELPSGTWTVAKDVTVTAQWTAKATVKVTFVYADGTTTEATCYANEAITDIPNAAAKSVTGYTVDTNWYTDSACTTVATFNSVAANTTVYAKKTAKSYTVTLNADGGNGAPASATATYDAKFSLDAPTKEGYNFLGWYNGETLVVKDGEIKWNIDNDNLTLTAKWEAKTYTVTLKSEGAVVQTLKITYGESYTLPTPTNNNEDYTFVAWKQNGTKIANMGVWTYTAAGENVVLEAEWKVESWTQNY